MIVVDASAVVEFLTRPARVDLARRIRSDRLHAPHLVDVEVAHALRGLEIRAELGADRVSDAHLDASQLTIQRYPHRPLLLRAWELRHNLTIYDAVYVALAELLGAPLVTCDARLSAAPGHDATIELFA